MYVNVSLTHSVHVRQHIFIVHVTIDHYLHQIILITKLSNTPVLWLITQKMTVQYTLFSLFSI